MGASLYPDFFNDVFGPIMQPGSSGGFAGPVRIGNVARALVVQPLVEAHFSFAPEGGSLSQLAVFMTDRGYLGGVLGFATDDVRLFDAASQAHASGLHYSFDHAASGVLGTHDVSVEVEDDIHGCGRLVASSIGGGMIEVRSVNGFALSWRADTNALIVFGPDGAIDRRGIEAFSQEHARHVVALQPLIHDQHARPGDHDTAFLFELAEPADIDEAAALFPAAHVLMLPAQLPVVSTNDRKPQLFSTVPEWRAVAEGRGISFVQAAIEYEKAFSGWDDKAIWDRFELIASILHDQVHALQDRGYDRVADTPMLPVYGRQWDAYRREVNPISDGLTARIIEYALSVNAKIPGVLIVPGPMGTGGGYLFSAVEAVRQHRGLGHDRVVEALVIAAALGAIAYTHTNASGEVGCVGESGVCCAMASGALVWLVGGTEQQVEWAASMALQGSMGLTCDPIPGGKEFPCLTRTVRAAVTAPLYADLALSGIDPLVPYHEMLQAIESHRRMSDPDLLYGSRCGTCLTPTADRCKEWLESYTEGTFAS